MRVFARASEFEVGRPVLPWFYAIAVNELHGLRRRIARDRNRTEEDNAARLLPANDDPERALLDHELRRCLDQAIASLDEDSAEVIRSMLNEDAPRPSVSAVAFRKRVSRAYAKLRMLLGGLYGK